jgi:aldehyde dehydrogenase (NAD+)
MTAPGLVCGPCGTELSPNAKSYNQSAVPELPGPVAREEVFGLVLSVIAYNHDDEAVSIANDTDYGLAASVWSTNNARALAIAERIQAGSVWINDAHQINCQLPFGGYKQSGLGRELGPDALDACAEVKTVALDLPGGRATKPYDLLLSHADG